MSKKKYQNRSGKDKTDQEKLSLIRQSIKWTIK